MGCKFSIDTFEIHRFSMMRACHRKNWQKLAKRNPLPSEELWYRRGLLGGKFLGFFRDFPGKFRGFFQNFGIFHFNHD